MVKICQEILLTRLNMMFHRSFILTVRHTFTHSFSTYHCVYMLPFSLVRRELHTHTHTHTRTRVAFLLPIRCIDHRCCCTIHIVNDCFRNRRIEMFNIFAFVHHRC
jgi:hypothetical protein